MHSWAWSCWPLSSFSPSAGEFTACGKTEDQFGGQGFGPGGSGGPAGNAREGEIHIRKTKGAGEKRVRKDVGDYIEFEEVPATETDKNDPDKQ